MQMPAATGVARVVRSTSDTVVTQAVIDTARSVGQELHADFVLVGPITRTQAGAYSSNHVVYLVYRLSPARLGVFFSKAHVLESLNPNAESAGLKLGDILLGINGRPASELDAALLALSPGSDVRVDVKRGDKVETLIIRALDNPPLHLTLAEAVPTIGPR